MAMEKKELQFLGVFGIFKESFKLIFQWRKIFSKLTLALILPNTLITLAYVAVSPFLSSKIFSNLSTNLGNNTEAGLPTYNHVSSSSSSNWVVYLLFNLAYLLFSVTFSLLTVSAISYTVACIYAAAKEITFKKAMSVVPRVWKKLIITYLSIFLILFAYTFVFLLVLGILLGFLMFSMSNGKSVGLQVGLSVLVIIGLILYLVGMFYINIMLLFANIISVLEDHFGIEAMKKSKKLIKGNLGTSIGVYLVLILCSLPSTLLGMHLRVNDVSKVVFGGEIGYGILALVWLTFLRLLSLVVQTVLYFVCKAYHHEDINKSVEYSPLNSKDVQFNQLDV